MPFLELVVFVLWTPNASNWAIEWIGDLAEFLIRNRVVQGPATFA
jgi:hypothetical protein